MLVIKLSVSEYNLEKIKFWKVFEGDLRDLIITKYSTFEYEMKYFKTLNYNIKTFLKPKILENTAK